MDKYKLNNQAIVEARKVMKRVGFHFDSKKNQFIYFELVFFYLNFFLVTLY
jgi:hypothetical protein